jgi:hypothetical protein
MTKNWDIDFAFGRRGEKLVEQIFGDKTKVEVKSERDKWYDTGNIAFELRYTGSPSGILATDADWWIHLFYYKNEMQFAFILPVKRLQKMLQTFQMSHLGTIVKGGDNNQSEILLINREVFFKIISFWGV